MNNKDCCDSITTMDCESIIIPKWKDFIQHLSDGKTLTFDEVNFDSELLHCDGNKKEQKIFMNELSQVIKTTTTIIKSVAIQNYGGLSEEVFQNLVCSVNANIDTLEFLKIIEFGTNRSISNETFALVVADLVRTNTSIKDLDLSGNETRSSCYTTIVHSMKYNQTIIDLNLAFNQIQDDGCVAIAESLKYNNTLRNLNIDRNGIGSHGCLAMANILKLNSTLQQLKLSSNEIEDCGCIALAKALEQNNTLVELDIKQNNISDKGAVAIAEMLKKNTALFHLDLTQNEIGEIGFDALLDALKHNNTLKRLYYEGNKPISEDGIIVMKNILQHDNYSLMHFKYDYYGVRENPQIVKALKQNQDYCCKKFIHVNVNQNMNIPRDIYLTTMIRGCCQLKRANRYKRFAPINILYSWIRQNPSFILKDQ